jgi:Flp pilus assembly protein TadD
MSLLFAALHQAAHEHRAAVAAQQGTAYNPPVAVVSARRNWFNLALVLLTGMVGGAALVIVVLLQQPSFSPSDLGASRYAGRDAPVTKLVSDNGNNHKTAASQTPSPVAVANTAVAEATTVEAPPDIRFGISLANKAEETAQPEGDKVEVNHQQVQDNLPAPVVAAIAKQIEPYVQVKTEKTIDIVVSKAAPVPMIEVASKAAKTSQGSVKNKPDMELNAARAEGGAAAALARGEHQSALRSYQAVLNSDPDNKEALVGKAMALQQSGATAIALAQWRLLADKYPQDSTIVTSYAAALASVDAGAARGLLQKLLVEQPTFAPALSAVAALDAKAGDMAAAQTGQEQAWALEKENPAHRLNLAILADKRGDKAQALELYKQAQAAYANGGWKATLPMSWSAVQARIAYLAQQAP